MNVLRAVGQSCGATAYRVVPSDMRMVLVSGQQPAC